MLTGFPIQSLADAPAMVEYSRFPAALATAAEVYANLESAVRAAEKSKRGAIFIEYTQQMERLDKMAKLRLEDLKTALKFGPKEMAKFDNEGPAAELEIDGLGIEGNTSKPAPSPKAEGANGLAVADLTSTNDSPAVDVTGLRSFRS